MLSRPTKTNGTLPKQGAGRGGQTVCHRRSLEERRSTIYRELIRRVDLSTRRYVCMDVNRMWTRREWRQHDVYSVPGARTVSPGRHPKNVVRSEDQVVLWRQRAIIVIEETIVERS